MARAFDDEVGPRRQHRLGVGDRRAAAGQDLRQAGARRIEGAGPDERGQTRDRRGDVLREHLRQPARDGAEADQP